MLDIWLTILSFALCVCVCLEGMQTAEAEQQRLSGVFFTTMLLSLVFEEVYFPCLLFVEFPLIECRKQCFERRYQQDQRLEMLHGDMLCHFYFVTGMPAGTLSQRPSGVDEGDEGSCLISLHIARTFVAEQGQWKRHGNLMKSSQRIKSVFFLMCFALNWSPSVSFVLLFDLFRATDLQVSILSLSKDFQALLSSVQGQQIMNLSEIVSF